MGPLFHGLSQGLGQDLQAHLKIRQGQDPLPCSLRVVSSLEFPTHCQSEVFISSLAFAQRPLQCLAILMSPRGSTECKQRSSKKESTSNMKSQF